VLIDWHTHIHSPQNQAKPYWQGRCPMTLENVLAAHDLAGLDKSVISNAGHFLRFCKTVQETVAGLEDSNRYPRQMSRSATPTSWSRWRPASRAAATSAYASSNGQWRTMIAAPSSSIRATRVTIRMPTRRGHSSSW